MALSAEAKYLLSRFFCFVEKYLNFSNKNE